MDNNDQILLIGQTLPFDKEFKDVKHGETLEEKTIIFRDGDDEYANIFLLKVGLNGNGWGVGQETFEERANEFLLNPVLIDPDGKVHASNSNGTGKYPLAHILENQNPLVAGLITKVMKYDTNGDGKNDLARGIMKLDKDKRERFHQAIKDGINETSPTLLPLNINEPAQKLLTYKPVNVVFTKNGAYLEHAKVKSLCKGSENSCSNALAASLEKNNVSLIQLLGNKDNMSSNDNGTTASAPQSINSSTTPNPNTPVGSTFNISYGTTTGNELQKQETKEPQKQEPTPEQFEIEELRKQVKEQNAELLTSFRNEIAPIDLFEGKEEDQKAFYKTLGDDVQKVKWFRDVAKFYVPKMIALYEKSKAKVPLEENSNNEKKDETTKNPLSATLANVDLPKFNNDSKITKIDDLMKYSLSDLIAMNKRLIKGDNQQ